MLSFWQRQLKIHTDYTLSMEEKKCELQTRGLVKAFAAHDPAVNYLTSTDESLKLTREERMHIVPILCKYSDSPTVVDKLQHSLKEDLAYCRV